jgi:hypothetical protein
MSSVNIWRRESHSALHFQGPCLLYRHVQPMFVSVRLLIYLWTRSTLSLWFLQVGLLCSSFGWKNMPDTKTSLPSRLSILPPFQDDSPYQSWPTSKSVGRARISCPSTLLPVNATVYMSRACLLPSVGTESEPEFSVLGNPSAGPRGQSVTDDFGRVKLSCTCQVTLVLTNDWSSMQVRCGYHYVAFC